MRLTRHVSGGLDPVVLARRIGLEADEWQQEVLRSPHPRELLIVHRQGGKSATAAVAAVHCALYRPDSLVLVVSPSQRQSQELFRTVLTLYRGLGRPVEAESENALSMTLENGSRVVALPADATTIRGYSAVNLLIVDEAAFVGDDTMAAVRPMLAISDGRMMAMSTPFGRRGWFFEASKSSEWRVTKITADQCPRITPEFLAAERNALGDWRFRQEYMCEFVDVAGMMFTTDDIDAMFGGGDLGALADDPFFGRQPAVSVLPPPAASSQCPRRRDGHYWHIGQCIHCGTNKPLLTAGGVL